MKLVLDTAVMVAAIRSDRGASRRLLIEVLQRRVSVAVSVALMIEYEAVMTRPQHLAAAGLSETEVATLLDAFAAVAVPVRLSFLWRPSLRDPDDDMVLEAAANGHVDAIVTFNHRDFAEAHRFGVAIMSPGEVLRRMEISQ